MLAASLIGLVVISVFAMVTVPASTQCNAPTRSKAGKYQAQVVRFGDVTEYCLADPGRDANGIAVGPDGSVWFGEQSIGGFGHLYPNGTVVEYAWPGYPNLGFANSSYPKALIWNVALWNGRVWAADNNGYLVNGLDPENGSTVELNVTAASHPLESAPALAPFLLAPSPDGSMWFTALPYLTGGELPVVGRVSANLSVALYGVAGLGHQEPIQIAFFNSTLAYMVALNPVNATDSGLYSFDPQAPSSTIATTRVGGNFTLIYPDSLAIADGSIWITQHGSSAVVSYNLKSGVWTTLPTSNVNYIYATYPYFIQSSGGKVWFNEHYANEIALLKPASGTLTEYSEADPPVENGSYIQQDLTIAASDDGLWFTSWNGNYIGYVNGENAPSFSISLPNGNVTTLVPGGFTTVRFEVTGNWTHNLQVLVSDSEDYNSTPDKISIRPDMTNVPTGSGPATLDVAVSVQTSLPAGRYTIDVTVSDGLVRQSALLVLVVT